MMGPRRTHQVAPAPFENEEKDADDQDDGTQSRLAAPVDRVVFHTREGGSSQPPTVAQSTQSAIEMQFPMFLIPIHKFLGLTELLSHQELRRMNVLTERNDSMETIIFVSHQWTSFDNPDHTGRQLRALQRMFERMITGDVPEIDAPFTDKAAFKGKVKIAPHEWNGTLRNAFIWIDYAGVPQKEAANDAAVGSDGRCTRRGQLARKIPTHVLITRYNPRAFSLPHRHPPGSLQRPMT